MTRETARKLNNGVLMPQPGFGVWKIDDAKTAECVGWALEAGYRHVDTAAVYGNEAGVGKAIRASKVPRDDLFITTKLWNSAMREGKQLQAFEKSLATLGLDYVDLYLVHWPVEPLAATWEAMETILASGKARAIGVSNFQPHHLDSLLRSAKVTPAVNQIECHPHLNQEKLLAYCAEKGIACQAWSPLGGQGAPILEDAAILDVAVKHGKEPAQIVLRWDLQRGVTPLVKSETKARIASNRELFDFTLDDDDMARINALNRNKRYGPDPDAFDF